MLKKIIFTVVVFSTLLSFSQEKSINDYKYIIVPNHFEWLKSPDKYKVNSLTKFLFNKYGFTAFLSQEQFPKDLGKNKCLALTANVLDKSSMLSTSNAIVLKDCYNNVVFKTPVAKSKIKDFKKSYHDAIRKAFKTIKALNYAYKPSNISPSVVEINKQKDEVSFIKEENQVTEFVNPKVKVVEEVKPITIDSNILYAQPIKNGFQIVNNEPKVVFQILKSSKKEIFFIKGKNGIIYKIGENWIAEYYENDSLIKKKYSIKF